MLCLALIVAVCWAILTLKPVLWIQIRIDLAVLDPYPGAWKLTKSNKEINLNLLDYPKFLTLS